MRQILIAFCFLAVALQAHALNTNQQVYIRSGQAYENFMNTYGSHFVKAGTVLAAHITSVGIFAVIQELYGGIRVRKLDLSSMKTVDIHLNDRMIIWVNDHAVIEVNIHRFH